MKNKVIASILAATFVVLIIFVVILVIGKKEKTDLLLNWKVYLPEPQNIERIIYNSGFQDGEVLEIYRYTSDKIEEIIKSEYFTSINKDNKKFVEEKLENYYSILDSKGKEKFNKNVNKSLILTEKNYFYFIQDENNKETYLLLIIDTKENKMYCLESIF